MKVKKIANSAVSAQRRKCITLASQRSMRYRQVGASMVEFAIAAPLLLFFGLGVAQLGLVYHAKSMLNYATFEAARSGAVNNGEVEVMRKELGYRMAPIFGGTGKLADGAFAIARSAANAQDKTSTDLEVLNPTPATFAQHGESKTVPDPRDNDNLRSVIAIPNSHLKLRDHDDIKNELNIVDANLLKIRVTYGYQLRIPVLDMEIPGVRSTLKLLMLRIDPDNWKYYSRGMIPIQATATVRMQSEAWLSDEREPEVETFDSQYTWNIQEIEGQQNLTNPGDGGGEGGEGGEDGETDTPVACDTNGLPEDAEVEEQEAQSCGATDFGRISFAGRAHANIIGTGCA